MRSTVAAELGSARRFKPLSEFTYTSREAGVGVAVGVAVGAEVAVSTGVGVAVGASVLVGAVVGCEIAVAVGGGVLVGTAATRVGAEVAVLVTGVGDWHAARMIMNSSATNKRTMMFSSA
jgi:hypothetical protein